MGRTVQRAGSRCAPVGDHLCHRPRRHLRAPRWVDAGRCDTRRGQHAGHGPGGADRPVGRAAGAVRQVLGLAGDLVDELLVVLPRGGHLTAPPQITAPRPTSPWRTGRGAAVPPRRTPADVMGRDRNCTGRSMLDTQPAPTGTHTHRRAVRPSGQERTFATDELIVSKTDPRGVITYANDVFLRVSAYPAAEVIGQPHNLIRHPDMPRAVFKLLWDTLAERRGGFAYIPHPTARGAHQLGLGRAAPPPRPHRG